MISDLYKCALLALEPEKEVLEFKKETRWPSEIETLKETMLRSTIINEELIENQRNNFTVLLSLLETYGRHFPSFLDGFESRKRSSSLETELKENGSHDLVHASDKQD